MTDLYDYAFETVFCGFIQRNSALLQAIDAFEGALAVREDALEFTLPALYKFVCFANSMMPGTGREAYLQFRKALYQNPTNKHLMAKGGRVDLAIANRNHDLVVYKLRRT